MIQKQGNRALYGQKAIKVQCEMQLTRRNQKGVLKKRKPWKPRGHALTLTAKLKIQKKTYVWEKWFIMRC